MPTKAQEYARRKSLAPSIASTLEVPNMLGARRPSIVDGRRPSFLDYRRQSIVDSITGRSGIYQTSAHKERTQVKLENTYRLEPDDNFPSFKAKEVAQEVLEERLKDREYNKDECTKLSKTLADVIKQKVKALGNSRHKIVTLVAIGQAQESHPSVSFTSRCIWNDKLDTFAEATYKNKSLYAVGLVYAVYAD